MFFIDEVNSGVMKSKKIIFLFVALLVPSIIFVFLKMFGKNQFDVDVLYTDNMPEFTDKCNASYTLPYHLPDSVFAGLNKGDSAVFVYFGDANTTNFINRVLSRYSSDPVGHKVFDRSNAALRECIFILEEPFDVALVDTKGRIRGQYNSSEREEVDRLITELAILLRKY